MRNDDGVRHALVLHNVLVPQLRLLADKASHQGDTVRVVGNDDLDAALAQELGIAGKVGRLADDDARDPELDDRAGTHHAGRERRVEAHAAIGFLPSGLAQTVHLPVRDWIALLDALVASLGDETVSLGEHAADRTAALLEAGLSFGIS